MTAPTAARQSNRGRSAVRYTIEGLRNVPPELHEAVNMAAVPNDSA